MNIMNAIKWLVDKVTLSVQFVRVAIVPELVSPFTLQGANDTVSSTPFVRGWRPCDHPTTTPMLAPIPHASEVLVLSLGFSQTQRQYSNSAIT